MQLSLQKITAKIASFNPRAEKHGEKNVPAGDLKFELKSHASVLDSFDPSYRTFLFRKAEHSGDQPSLIEGDNLTSLAKPNLKPLNLTEDFPGYTIRLGSGLDLGKDLVLTEATLSNFKFEAIEGGSVSLSFSAEVHPDADQSGFLCQQIQNIVDLTLEPPLAAEQLPMGNAFTEAADEIGDEGARRAAHPADAHAVA